MSLEHLLAKNRAWASAVSDRDPTFFRTLSEQQSPRYLWVGCSDSRVPANEIVDLLPGELFVHRNVANVVVHTDLNCLSVLQYGIDVLGAEHVIVCGHYGCGGVVAALHDQRSGLIDNWLRHVQDVAEKWGGLLDGLDERDRIDRLCELNVIEQAANVAQTTVMREAWERGQNVRVHGWIYGLTDGLVRDLHVTMRGADDIRPQVAAAIAGLPERGAGA